MLHCCRTVYVHALAIHTSGTLWYLNFEVLEHPSCSPDLVPLDYYVFGPLKNDFQRILLSL